VKKKLLILALHLAANGYDAYSTHRVMQHPRSYETNPISRPFVTRGTPILVTYFATDFALETFGAYKLRKYGHPEWARAWEVVNIADHTEGIVVCKTLGH
jgi:hypothetical protein